MNFGTRTPARRWLSVVAFSLAIGTLQGCIGGGGGGGGGGGSSSTSEPQPTQTVVEQQPLELITESPTQPEAGNSKPASTPSTGTIGSGGTSGSGTTGSITKPDPNLGTGMLELIGINIAGAEFTSSELPGKHNTHYFFPNAGDFDKWSLKGIKSVRFPIKWERLQPVLNGEFDPTYAGLIDTMFSRAASANIDIILDVHNYGRYRKNIIGSAEVPYSAYQNLMERIAMRWKDRSSLYAYDIMNEPYGDSDKTWLVAAQRGIDGVRKHDRQRPIYIEGMSWASAARWATHSNELLKLVDPVDNLVFSAHLYLDSDASGTYKDGPDAVVDPMVGVKRATPFINWLKKNYKRGQIGESGIPNDPRYLKAMDNLLAYLQQNCVPVTYWAAGRAWGNYQLSVEPNKDGTDKQQWKLLEKYLGKGNCSDYGPSA